MTRHPAANRLALALVTVFAPASARAGEPTRVTAATYYRTFSHAHPVLKRIRPGEAVATRTIDSGGQDERGVSRGDPFNPLTGPFHVDGAEPGDALAVRLKRVRLNRDWGWSAYRLGLFSLTPEAAENVYPSAYKPDLVRKGRSNLVPWDIDLRRNVVRLREPRSRAHPLEFPARPMLGCIGVAPAGDFAPTSGPSGPYGGDLDDNRVGEGVTVYLPVYHPGGLLFLGGSQPEFASALDNALKAATTDMVEWLTKGYGLEPWAAHLLIGYQGRYDVITVAGSMGLRLKKDRLPKPGPTGAGKGAVKPPADGVESVKPDGPPGAGPGRRP
ncbi:MAG: acetamidase/formamidase family protein [Planctomycetia bacterium]|nr:acetamidase/formamidase family protein [Planctomycetia bacterium]